MNKSIDHEAAGDRDHPQSAERAASSARGSTTVDDDVAAIDQLCASWPIPGAQPREQVTARRPVYYASWVPAALNCLNRYAKVADPDELDELYTTKYRTLLVCARLGWARECSEGYQLGKFRFHSPSALDCSSGNESPHFNLCEGRIDDRARASRILAIFLAEHPLTPGEEEALTAHVTQLKQERLAYEARCAARLQREDEEENLYAPGDDDMSDEVDDLFPW